MGKRSLLTNIEKAVDLSAIKKIKGVSTASAFTLDKSKSLPELTALFCAKKDRAKVLNILSPKTFPITKPGENEHQSAVWIENLNK